MSASAERPRLSLTLAVAVALGVGLVSRIAQYFGRQDLWLDEAMLASSIVNRSMRALIFSPLEFNQMAPPGYLEWAKASVLTFGPNELALRLPAIICSVASLLLFAILAREIFSKAATAFAVAVFAISPLLLSYAAEVKPYSGDVFAAVLLTLTALKMREARFASRWLWTAALLPLVIVWLSDPSVLVIGGLGLGLGLLAWLERDRIALKAARILAPAWSLAAIASLLGSQRRLGGGTGEAMRGFWKFAFMPIPPRSVDESLWLWRTFLEFFQGGLGIRTLGGLCIAVAAFGIWSLWKHGRRDVVVLVNGPLLLSIIASAAHRYPLGGRVSLFLLPAFIIALTAGAESISRLFRSYDWIALAAIFLLFADPPDFVLKAKTPPWLTENIRPVLAQVAENRMPGDRIYVFWGAVPATDFYGQEYGIGRDEYFRGCQCRKDWDAYQHEFDQFRGSSRLWVVFSHDRHEGQREGILRYLDRIGVQQRNYAYPPLSSPRQDAAVFLYDLSR